MQKNKYNVVLKATSLFGSVQGLNILLNIVRTKFVAILIGAEGVGLNSIYNETRELLHSTSNLGLDMSGVRDISKAYEDLDECKDPTKYDLLRKNISDNVALLRSWALILALFGTLLCLIFAAPLSLFTFNDYNHTWGYAILSPAVGFSTITCAELAVLKGLRRLRWLATVSVLNVVAGLVITLPIYYVWGIHGVLPALVALSFACMMLTYTYSNRAEKVRFSFAKEKLKHGRQMLTVGLNFVVCNIIAHIALLGIQAWLNNHASLQVVGLYNAGYSMTMTYAGMVFAAMDTDYFPRLSGIINDHEARTETILKQLDVTLILITPLLAAVIVALPLIVPLLLSHEFESIIPMTQITAVGLLFRAIYLPNAYIPLAAGDNKTFLWINIIGALDILLVIVGYYYYGLTGMGVALTIQNGIDMAIVLGVSRWKYSVVFSRNRMLSMGTFTVLLFATYACCHIFEGWLYWVVGIGLTLLTTLYSFNRYRKA